MPVIRLEASGLTCRRGGREIFSGVGFSLSAGEALAVTGRNGAGKTSLLRIVAGLLAPVAGEISFSDGARESSAGEEAHYLGHQDAIKAALTARENLQFWIDYLGGHGSANDALTAFGLGTLANLPAGYLSAGQRRRLSLARLVVIERPIWILDEPGASLDDAARDALARLMADHLDRGGLIVAATHAPLKLPRARELRLGGAPFGGAA